WSVFSVRSWRVARSHRRTVPPYSPAARALPSGARASRPDVRTESRSLPAAASQTFTVPSLLLTARPLPPEAQPRRVADRKAAFSFPVAASHSCTVEYPYGPSPVSTRLPSEEMWRADSAPNRPRERRTFPAAVSYRRSVPSGPRAARVL